MSTAKPEPRLIMQLAAQILKETEDLSPNGDFLQCLRYELTWRKIPGRENAELPCMYRYHQDRIYDATQTALKIWRTVTDILESSEGA